MANILPHTISIPDRLLAKALAGHPLQAITELQTHIAQSENDGALWSALGIAFGLAGQFDQAISALNRALAALPGHVLSKAYMGIFLHLTGKHEQASDLLDYEGMTSQVKLHAEKNDGQINAFHTDLIAHLRQHPSLTWQLANKATQGGWQSGELLQDDAPVIRELHQLLRAGVQQIMRSWGEDEEELASKFPLRMSAWGVILQSGGYQEPHVHQAGILSGVYYVAVPPMSGGPHAGALSFPVALPWLPQAGIRSDAFFIQPQAAHMVLFPSYFWHQTVPFVGNEDRICIAFDIFPPEASS